MLSKLPSRPSSVHQFRVMQTVTPLSLGIVLLTSVGMPAQAQFGGFPTQSPTTQVIGSPIPSPVPVVPGTTNPYSLSPYNSHSDYNPNHSYYDPYNYNGYNRGIITPGSGVIRNSTLINPTVINSRISDSVLVDPVIIDSRGYPQRVFRQPSVIYNPPIYNRPIYNRYNHPGVRIRIGY